MTRPVRYMSFALLLACLLTLSACGADYSTPEATAQNFVKAMNAEDVDAAADCFVAAEQAKAREEWTKSNEKRKQEGKEMQAEMSFKSVEKDGNWTLAVISMKDKSSGKSFDMKMVMVEEDGKWKLSDKKSEEYQKAKLEEMFKK
ncbi:MAG: DUF4878 domain-containing protein [Planctomycetes bacterium]|nr:DUF4878 domain-containing protein [Planctomycetota bacterium]MCB9935462.1 DUF4878 domain-containing protein [Planctomycetota bacterium]